MKYDCPAKHRSTVEAGPDRWPSNREWTKCGPVLTWTHTTAEGRVLWAMPTYLNGGGYWFSTGGSFYGSTGRDGCHDDPFPNWHALEREVDRVLGEGRT